MTSAVTEELAWTEIKWPFGRDAWEAGRAFRCADASCGGAEVYVRPKIGFCNCATGVADDDELERVADLYLLTDHYRPGMSAQEAQIGDLHGLARSFTLDLGPLGKRHALAIAVSRRCDVVIATIVSSAPTDRRSERAAFALLESEAVQSWIASALQPPQ